MNFSELIYRFVSFSRFSDGFFSPPKLWIRARQIICTLFSRGIGIEHEDIHELIVPLTRQIRKKILVLWPVNISSSAEGDFLPNRNRIHQDSSLKGTITFRMVKILLWILNRWLGLWWQIFERNNDIQMREKSSKCPWVRVWHMVFTMSALSLVFSLCNDNLFCLKWLRFDVRLSWSDALRGVKV